MSHTNVIILYDVPSTVPQPWVPNIWRIRFILNFKRLPYRTVWVELPDVETTLRSIGAPPTSYKSDNRPVYTLPVIVDSMRSRSQPTVLSNANTISEYLETCYPARPVFPDGSRALQTLFVHYIQDVFAKPLLPILVPLSHQRLPERSQAHFTNPTAVNQPQLSGSQREQAWRAVKEQFDFLAATMDKNAGSDGDGVVAMGREMDRLEFPSADNVQAESSQGPSRGTGLRLVIPSLKTIQALKGKQKGKNGSAIDTTPVQKTPRPAKLKPLKEVLTKLIAQIKKKDDYAFFLKPVDPALVPGYADLVKQPMDLGTMTTKVARGKYKTLEEFATDLRLVTGNAKLFNPPGTIYYTEADRIEAYALQHITRATATVIEVETDWNVDIENEGVPTPNVDDDDDDDGREKSTAMDVDGSMRGRSPSVASTGTPVVGRSKGKGKRKAGMLSESLEDGGHLPGYKDGVGVFPPGSEFAELMLSSKLKGKRYRTKKERMRIERGGPPHAADGSLDYTELEDPFSVLSIFLPETRSLPLMTGLYPSASSADPSLPSLPAPINVAPHIRPEIRPVLLKRPPNRGNRKHWSITRMTSTRRTREANEEDSSGFFQMPQDPQHIDYGTFATLLDQLAHESRTKLTPADLSAADKLLLAIRGSTDINLPDWDLTVPPKSAHGETYWKQKVAPAEDYVRDVVYGGPEGFSYVRSLAAFVQHDGPRRKKPRLEDPSPGDLGVPLADWVVQSIVDPLTDGRHRLLRDTAAILKAHQPDPSPVGQLIDRSLRLLPQAARDLSALQDMVGSSLDMASLIKEPNELFVADEVWEGASYMEEQRKRMEAEREKALVESPAKNAAEYLAFAIQSHKEAESPRQKPTYEGPDVLHHALDWSAVAIQELAKKPPLDDDAMDVDTDGKTDEDPHMRKLRLNLLALSKRAPLDKVARLPVSLVPAHIRHVIPTTES
ncbi:hypothetical protein EIP91_006995 [Steccherinum ochraceum]|uniref:Bromo domain-containing protein n=1 Tax=Steccherinum ochraceum TaxID=92696 RepID=A0A4R0RQU5_9APHY|nr:hypothetical protein EIP91_006995 [Steccherinum ochraceum]